MVKGLFSVVEGLSKVILCNLHWVQAYLTSIALLLNPKP